MEGVQENFSQFSPGIDFNGTRRAPAKKLIIKNFKMKAKPVDDFQVGFKVCLYFRIFSQV